MGYAEESLRNAVQTCHDLEAAAGLTKAMERAREGSFMPDFEASSDEYFAEEHDAVRQMTRDAYFSVGDLDARKSLIVAHRKMEEEVLSVEAQQMAEAERDLARAQEQELSAPYGAAAMWAVAFVGIGYGVFGLPGAMAGMVAGFFMGMNTLSTAKREAQGNIKRARDAADDMRQSSALSALRPAFFSLDEELLGERQPEIDRHSAYSNLWEARHAGKVRNDSKRRLSA